MKGAEFDAVSSGGVGSSGTSFNFNHSLGDLGDDGLILVLTSTEDTSNQRNVSSVTVGGVAASLVSGSRAVGSDASNRMTIEAWEIRGANVPAAGTRQVVVNHSSSPDRSRVAVCISYKRVKDQAREALGSNAGSGNTTFSANVTTLTKNALLVAWYGSQNSAAASFTTGETQRFQDGTPSGEDQSALLGDRLDAEDIGSKTVTVSMTNPESQALIALAYETVPARQGGAFLYHMI